MHPCVPSMNSATEFAQVFAALWAKPDADALVAQLHEDVVLRQPNCPDLFGKAAAHAEFRRLLRWLPNLHGVVIRAVDENTVVFIEWEIRIPVGNHEIAIPAIDRFLFKDDLVIERHAYFDQVRLILAVLKHPSLWLGYLRYLFGSGS
jgi:ketosteroid isomerase-like protein